jgi:hypothetical protein
MAASADSDARKLTKTSSQKEMRASKKLPTPKRAVVSKLRLTDSRASSMLRTTALLRRTLLVAEQRSRPITRQSHVKPRFVCAHVRAHLLFGV